jgi:dihydroorotase
MSANPAHILGLQDRGIIKAGLRADLVVVAPEAEWTVEPERFRSRGHCTALQGKKLYGKVLTEIFEGRIVYSL